MKKEKAQAIALYLNLTCNHMTAKSEWDTTFKTYVVTITNRSGVHSYSRIKDLRNARYAIPSGLKTLELLFNL